MATKALPAQDVLHQLLSYDPETGKLYWKERPVEMFPAVTPARSRSLCRLWNERYAEKEAFTAVADGYFTGSINGSNFKAHRVIWKMMLGEDATQVDHISGDRADNRLINLRNVDPSANARNKRVSAKNSVLGVHQWSHRGFHYWVAHIGGKKQRYCKTFEEAVAARKAAERDNGFHENHGRSS